MCRSLVEVIRFAQAGQSGAIGLSLTSRGAYPLVRLFASIMGLLGMITMLLRAMIHGGSLDATAPKAVLGLLAFLIVGAIVGAIAKGTVDDSVRMQLRKEMDAMSDSTAK